MNWFEAFLLIPFPTQNAPLISSLRIFLFFLTLFVKYLRRCFVSYKEVYDKRTLKFDWKIIGFNYMAYNLKIHVLIEEKIFFP